MAFVLRLFQRAHVGLGQFRRLADLDAIGDSRELGVDFPELVERGFGATLELVEAILVDLVGDLGPDLRLPAGFGVPDALRQPRVEIGRYRLAGDPLEFVGPQGRQRVDFGLLLAVKLEPFGGALFATLQRR